MLSSDSSKSGKGIFSAMGYFIAGIFSLFLISFVSLATSQTADGDNQCGAVPKDGVPTHLLLKLLTEGNLGKIGEHVAQMESRITNLIYNATLSFTTVISSLSFQIYVLQQQVQELSSCCRDGPTTGPTTSDPYPSKLQRHTTINSMYTWIYVSSPINHPLQLCS